jgi:hypothetical protein
MTLRLLNDEVLTSLHMLAQTLDELAGQVTLSLSVLIEDAQVNIQMGSRDQTCRARAIVQRV